MLNKIVAQIVYWLEPYEANLICTFTMFDVPSSIQVLANPDRA